MNIFYLSHNPQEAAEMHCDKHVVKMIVEYCQLLSTAHRILDGKPFQNVIEINNINRTKKKNTLWLLDDERENILYKATHISHPSSLWTMQSNENYLWLYQLLSYLIKEYQWRYEKNEHGCLKLLEPLSKLPFNIKKDVFTEPTPAMPESYIIHGDSISSYRSYYCAEKSSFATWKKREKPFWWLI